MAKNNVTQYDTTAANNTDVGGISIAEGMSPSNVNNAMRELMKQTADWVSGSQAITKLTTTGDIELGHASDTTIARSGAGDITVEGNAVYRAGGTDVPVADGGTGASDAATALTNLGAQADLDVPSQAEAEAGTATTERVWTAQRVGQAVAALAGGGGAWTKINTVEASNDATVTVTGLNSAYDTFAIAISDMVPTTDGTSTPYMRVGDSSGIKTGSQYQSHAHYNDSSSNSYSAWVNHTDKWPIGSIASTMGNDTGEGFGGIFYIHRPGDANTYPIITGHGGYVTSQYAIRGGFLYGVYHDPLTLDRVQIFTDSSNWNTGRITVWGISHA